MSKNARIHYRTCNLCEAMCGIKIELEDDKIISISGNENDVLSHGYICPKAVALQDVYNDPDRLKRPIRKTPSGWEEISWEAAFDFVAQKAIAIQQEFGHDAIGIYLGNPNVHNVGALLYGPQLIKALKTKNRFTATSVDQLPHHVVAQYMFGHNFLLPIPDIERTDFFLCMGANPLASNGSIMTTGGMLPKLNAIKARGGKVITVDPRRTETAKKADQHIFIKPGTDVYLLAALIHEVVEIKDFKSTRLAKHCNQVTELKETFSTFTPQKVSLITGIPSDVIEQLAIDFCAAESAVCYGRIGLSIQEHGTLCQWLVNLLNIVTGNLDEVGGAMFTHPAIDILAKHSKGTQDKQDRWKGRVSGISEFNGELPVSTLSDEILEPGDGQIKAMFTVAGNPVLSTPNGRKLEDALASLNFMVSIDIYLNETTKHADIILPPAAGLETEQFDLVFNVLAVHNVVKYSEALYPIKENQRFEWQIVHELASRIKNNGKAPAQAAMPPRMMLDFALKASSYNQEGFDLSIDHLLEEQNGIDLGNLRSSLPDRLFTSDKKINLFPDIFIERLLSLPLNDIKEEDHFLLIGRRHLRSNNSWMHNSERLVKGKSRCTLMMHPDDAQRLSIVNGQKVIVKSRVGSLQIEAELTEDLMIGVVSIPHGWGHHRNGIKIEIAEKHAGVSINDITDDAFFDPLFGNGALNGVKVALHPTEL